MAVLAALLVGACRDAPLQPPAARPTALRRAAQFVEQCATRYPQKPVSSRYGVGTNRLSNYEFSYPADPIGEGTYESLARLLGQANVGWVRVDFDWGRVIGSSPDTNNLEWRAMDRAINRAVCNGQNILGNLAYTPGWAVSASRPGYEAAKWFTYLPDDMNHWAAFVRAAVNRYPQIRYWSVWNEPNVRDYFRGQANGTETQLIADYNRLLGAAAPHIVSNVDGRGRRYLVGLELAGAHRDLLKPWIRGVLGGPHAGSVDVVAVHHYAHDYDIKDQMYNGVATYNAAAIPGGWRWDVWLTEAGPVGCNAGLTQGERDAQYWCVGNPNINIDDQYQADNLRGVMVAMNSAPSSSRWTKTFYWHSHAENAGVDAGNNWGVLGGARANAVFGRPAFTAYAGLAGPLRVSGPSQGINEPVPTTALPAVSDRYYYVWEYRWCGTNSVDCTYQWYHYHEGSGYTTAAPYVGSDDLWVDVRVRQYAWGGGPQLGAASRRILGGASCTSPRGCPTTAATGGMEGAATSGDADTTDVSRTSPGDTTAAVPRPVRVPPGTSARNAERMKGRQGRGNR